MRRGVFISFEGTEGSGKTTQIKLLADRLSSVGHPVTVFREPGGTALGEEIRHTLKHSQANSLMAPETELLLMNASRAQLVREMIRPALERGVNVLCDRFYDSTIAYQGHGRGLDLERVRTIIDFAVGETRPDLTLVLKVPIAVSEARRRARTVREGEVRDRFEEADQAFFLRVEQGFGSLAESEPDRIRVIDATHAEAEVHIQIWKWVQPLVEHHPEFGATTYKSTGEWETKKLDDET